MSVEYWRNRKITPQKMRREIFVVRAVDPLWAVTYRPNEPQEAIYDSRELMTRLLSNLGLQLPLDTVSLVNVTTEKNPQTFEAIKEKLSGYDLAEMPNDVLPGFNIPFQEWFRLFETETPVYEGTLVLVLDQKIFDHWCSNLDIPLKVDGSCVLLVKSDPLEVVSVA